MTGAEVLDVARDSLWTLLVVSGPPMIIVLLIGLGISFFQALTQIQEMTLTFVPKMVAMTAIMVLLLPFMGSAMGSFMERLTDRIVAGG
jgi:flagellar biosynthetic protein FliQ